MSLTIEVDSKKAFIMIGRIRPTMQIVVEREGEKWSTAVLKRARSSATPHPGRDTGAIAQSIKQTLLGRGTNFYSRLYTRDPGAVALEFGRSPGQPMPPISAITEWAVRHGLPAKAGWVIGRAIGRYGTEGIHYMEKAEEYAQSILPRYTVSIANSIISGIKV